jgi:hypothetical protein
MSDPLKELAEKHARLVQEAEEKERAAEELQEEIEELQRLQQLAEKHGLIITSKLAPPTSPANDQPNGPRKRLPNEPDPNSLTRRVQRIGAEILVANGRVMSTRELIAALETRGVVITSKHPVKAVSAFLSHSDTVYATGNGWWVHGAPAPMPSQHSHSVALAAPPPKRKPSKPYWPKIVDKLRGRERFTIDDVVGELKKVGKSIDRKSVRSKLTHLVAAREVERIADGVFRVPQQGASGDQLRAMGIIPAHARLIGEDAA